MDKLVQLLNEFEDLTDAEKCEQWYIDDYGRMSDGGWWFQGTESWICSKKFGFIKWLIENNKMDKEKIIMAETLPITDVNEDYLLMLLAIQDDPIATLSFMLK